MRRHVGRHSNRDAGAAIDDEVRERRREHGGFGEALVIVGHEIDRVLLHVLHQQRAEMRQARLGITHRRRGIVFDGAEVALAIHEFLAHHPRLRHVNERRINHRFTVRMVVTRSVAANLRALDVLASWKQREILHRVQNAALRGLESVAHVGQRARDDHGHRVVEERVLDLVRDVDLGNLLALRVSATARLLLRRLGRRRFSFVWHDAVLQKS